MAFRRITSSTVTPNCKFPVSIVRTVPSFDSGKCSRYIRQLESSKLDACRRPRPRSFSGCGAPSLLELSYGPFESKVSARVESHSFVSGTPKLDGELSQCHWEFLEFEGTSRRGFSSCCDILPASLSTTPSAGSTPRRSSHGPATNRHRSPPSSQGALTGPSGSGNAPQRRRLGVQCALPGNKMEIQSKPDSTGRDQKAPVRHHAHKPIRTAISHSIS
jgi:hypothetical protein